MADPNGTASICQAREMLRASSDRHGSDCAPSHAAFLSLLLCESLHYCLRLPHMRLLRFLQMLMPLLLQMPLLMASAGAMGPVIHLRFLCLSSAVPLPFLCVSSV